MTLRLPLFVLILTIFIQNTQAQISQDTFSFHTCMKFWKTGEPVSALPGVFRNCLPLPSHYLGLEPSIDSFCWKISFTPDTCSAPATMQVTKDQSFFTRNGVTVADLVLVSEHILGISPLTQMELRLADVNRSNSLTTLDLVEMRELILGLDSIIPNSASWRFYDNALEPYHAISLNQPPLFDTLVIYAGKTGDVDGDAATDENYQPNQDHAVALSVPQRSFLPGQSRLIPVSFAEGLHTDGFQFNLTIDTSKMEFEQLLVSTQIQGSANGFNQINPTFRNIVMAQHINFSENNFDAFAPFLYVNMRAKVATTVAEVLSISPDQMHNLWIDDQKKTHPLSLQFETASGTVDTDLLPAGKAVALPNPFTDFCYIQLELPEAQAVLVELFDIHGKLCYRQETPFGAGVAQLEIGQYLPRARGLYTYRLSAGSWSASGKVVRQ